MRDDKVCVVTRLGLDHTEILGKRLDEIAGQKVGIVQENNTLITLWQPRSVRKAFEKRVREKKGKIIYVRKPFSLKLNSPALYQKDNASLALATLQYLSKKDQFKVNRDRVRKIFLKTHFPGRMDVFIKKGKTIIADGAHNQQKMASFVESLKNVTTKKIPFLVAFKQGKDYQGMLDKIIPVASDIITTNFKTQGMDLEIKSEDGKKVVDYLKDKKFRKAKFVANNKKAIGELLRQESKHVAITGSLYLLSAVYSIIKQKH